MRPTTNETLVGGRSRKTSSANAGDLLFPPTTILVSSTSSVEGAHQTPPSVSAMTYFLADEATINNMMGSSSEDTSSGIFGVQSLESSGNSVTLGKESTRSKYFPIEHSSSDSKGNNIVHRESQLDLEQNEITIIAEVASNVKPSDTSSAFVGLESAACVNASHTELPPSCASSRPPEPEASYPPSESSLRVAQYPDSPFLSTPMSPGTRSVDDFSDSMADDVHLPAEEESVLESPPLSLAHSPAPLLRERPKEATSGTVVPLPPQFIMPTIKMPTRRPFTERGKRMPKLKVLVAGDSGIGKTSLIKSIIQICEDIVHVDPVPVSVSPKPGARPSKGMSSFYSMNDRSEGEPTRNITEVFASTKPYPHWWSEHEDSKVLKRRKSNTGDVVLERNLCFVDTPGYGSVTSFGDCVGPVVRYVEAQMERTHAILTTGYGDVLSLLSGSGTPQVDVVFYVILHRLKPVDVEYIRQLSPLTNVVPIIAKADSLNPQQITSLKLSILNDLAAAGIRPFSYGKTYEDIAHRLCGSCAPFAISSAVSSDQDNMDASVLMSPDYVPPLVPSELTELVNTTFDPDNIAWLKHIAAKKYLSWRSKLSLGTQGASPTSPGHRSITSSATASAAASVSSSLVVSSSRSNTSFALARVADHTQREERLAQARLAKWASELQRSLRAERERYERLAKGERAVWLTERLAECVSNGQLVPVSTLKKLREKEQVDGTTQQVHWGGISGKDPMGLLTAFEKLKKGAAYVAIGGSVVAIGFAINWFIRKYGVDWSEWISGH